VGSSNLGYLSKWLLLGIHFHLFLQSAILGFQDSQDIPNVGPSLNDVEVLVVQFSHEETAGRLGECSNERLQKLVLVNIVQNSFGRLAFRFLQRGECHHMAVHLFHLLAVAHRIIDIGRRDD
jgi:hypothetical protein